MRPFNLEAALSGAKLVTRDGREVYEFRNRGCGINYTYLAFVDGAGEASYTATGRWVLAEDHPFDLFLSDTQQPSPHIFITEIEKFLSGSAQKIYPKQARILQQHLNKFMEDYPQFKTGK